MNKVVAWFLRVFFAPVTMVLRMLYTIAAIAIVLSGCDFVIDVSNFGIPEDYLFAIVVFVTIGALLTAIGYRRFSHDRAADKLIAEGQIKDQYELPYDKRYDFGTIAGFICGAVAGAFLAPVAIDSYVIGAGMWTYAVVAGIIACLSTLILTPLFHFGLRKWLVKAREYAKKVAGEAKETGKVLAEVAQDLQNKQ